MTIMITTHDHDPHYNDDQDHDHDDDRNLDHGLREYMDIEGMENVNGDYMQRSLVFIGAGYDYRQTVI